MTIRKQFSHPESINGVYRPGAYYSTQRTFPQLFLIQALLMSAVEEACLMPAGLSVLTANRLLN